MAKFISTTFGTISGKHGTAVAVRTAKGENVLRVYKKAIDPNTSAQKKQREKFGFVNKMLAPFSRIFKITYRNSRGINKAVAYALKNAVRNEGETLILDYEKLQFASGSLQIPHAITATRPDTSTISVVWDATLELVDEYPDTLNVVLMNVNTHFTLVRENIALRDKGTISITLPESWQTAEILLWIYFASPESNITSESRFIAKL